MRYFAKPTNIVDQIEVYQSFIDDIAVDRNRNNSTSIRNAVALGLGPYHKFMTDQIYATINDRHEIVILAKFDSDVDLLKGYIPIAQDYTIPSPYCTSVFDEHGYKYNIITYTDEVFKNCDSVINLLQLIFEYTVSCSIDAADEFTLYTMLPLMMAFNHGWITSVEDIDSVSRISPHSHGFYKYILDAETLKGYLEKASPIINITEVYKIYNLSLKREPDKEKDNET